MCDLLYCVGEFKMIIDFQATNGGRIAIAQERILKVILTKSHYLNTYRVTVIYFNGSKLDEFNITTYPVSREEGVAIYDETLLMFAQGDVLVSSFINDDDVEYGVGENPTKIIGFKPNECK